MLSVFVTGYNALAAEDTDVSSTENYIDWYDLDIVDFFEIYDEAYLTFLEDDYLFEQFLEARAIMEIQAPAVEIYNVLKDAFWQEIDGYMELVFPDTYAGAWVDFDTLVIQVTNLYPETIAFYTSLIGNADHVRFTQVDFSYNLLRTFGEIFVDTLGDIVVGFGIDTMNNSYSITIDENSLQALDVHNSFTNLARVMPIPIDLSLSQPGEFFSLLGGSSADRHASIGLSGTRPGTGQAALLISGHAAVGAGTATPVQRSGQTIGTVQVLRFSSFTVGSPGTTQGDWAVVNLNAVGAAMVTNQLRNNTRIQAFTNSAPVNTVVNAIGQHTISTGTIKAVNQTFAAPFNGVWHSVSGLSRVNTFGTSPIPGDSGGAVWMTVGSFNSLTGIISGGPANLPVWYFSPLQHSSTHFSPRLIN